MRILATSCFGYRDTWYPFFKLLEAHWRDCPYPIWLLTDKFDEDDPEVQRVVKGVDGLNVYTAKGDWCTMLHEFCEKVNPHEPVMLMQDDFFINAPVRADLIADALNEMQATKAQCVRIYPCPGPMTDNGDGHFGEVMRGEPYRISCQAAIFNPEYVCQLTKAGGTAADFEIRGTQLSNDLPGTVLSWKREVTPFPISYQCSAISRAKWEPAAKELCDSLGIQVNWTMRPFVAVETKTVTV